ncbi:MAG: putative glycoside hydrolase, partial [Candidatus Pacebacteria bacterium]|nr:putative glycoside hydrolase [Candidatus Paceibacterota bacterium]
MTKIISLSISTIIGVIGVLLLLVVTAWIIFFSDISLRSLSYVSVVNVVEDPTMVRGPKVSHQEMPSEVRAIYMTACYGASKNLRAKLVNLIEQTELNSIIIDIKDYTGTIAVPTEANILAEGQEGKGCKIRDIKEFIELLHSKGIYVIGRITVFQDPLYATLHPELAVHKKSATTVPWSDYKGLHFIDIGAKAYWDYIVTLAKESHNKLGFDELNFDYVRYPSDGPMSDVYYTHSGVNGVVTDAKRASNLEDFFIYLHKELSKPNAHGEVPYTSEDLFGMTATNYDDLTIGQV